MAVPMQSASLWSVVTEQRELGINFSPNVVLPYQGLELEGF